MTTPCRSKGFACDCSGAAAVEFALVIGPLLLVFLAIIETGRLMWSGHALDEVAIAGARCVGLHAPGCEDVTSEMAVAHIIEAAQGWGIAIEEADISFDVDAGCAVDTGFRRVALSHRFDSVLPGLSEIDLESEACFPDQL